MKPIQWHLKNNWRAPESLEKIIPIPRALHPHLRWWLDEDYVLTGQPLHPIKYALQIRRTKRRVGCSLRRAHCQRGLVTARKQDAHKLPGAKGSFSSLETVSRPLCRQDSPSGNRQHFGVVLHKQGRGHEVRPALCSTVENHNLVHQETSDSQDTTHPRPAECSSRQAIQAGPNHSDGMVSPPRGVPSDLQQIAPATNRPICYEVQQQATFLCVPSTGSPGHGSGCTQSAMGGYGRIHLPTNSHPGQGSRETTGHPLHKIHSDCHGVAQHALVLGPSGHVKSDPIEPVQSTQPVDTALQSDPTQKSDNLNLHAWLLEPQQSKNRASLRQWQ